MDNVDNVELWSCGIVDNKYLFAIVDFGDFGKKMIWVIW